MSVEATGCNERVQLITPRSQFMNCLSYIFRGQGSQQFLQIFFPDFCSKYSVFP